MSSLYWLMKSTDDIIRQIKDGTLREDTSVELKRWLPNKDVLAKVLVGLANAGGGYLVIGIEESADGCKAVGLRESERVAIRMVETVCEEFCIHINTNIKKINVKGNDILIVEIHPLNAVTYFSRSSSPERLYANMRNEDGSTQKADDTKTYQKIYKYMTLETFMTCLYTGTPAHGVSLNRTNGETNMNAGSIVPNINFQMLMKLPLSSSPLVSHVSATVKPLLLSKMVSLKSKLRIILVKMRLYPYFRELVNIVKG